jgi:predicted ArsR family transcriptional regulator
MIDLAGGTSLDKKLTGTRSRITELLRRRQYTVEQLGKELKVSETAVRAQLALLQRDDIVEAMGEIKGARRPSLTYGLRPGVGLYFSKAYHTVLAHLVDILAVQMPKKEYIAVMRKLGRKLANSMPRPTGHLRARVEGTAKSYESFGTLMSVEEDGTKFIIRAHGCPFEEVVNVDGGICIAMETLMSRLIGVPVRQCCERGERTNCRFEVKKSLGRYTG